MRERNGDQLITDGPFAETKEQLAGYFVVECESLERALSIAGRFPEARLEAVEVSTDHGNVRRRLVTPSTILEDQLETLAPQVLAAVVRSRGIFDSAEEAVQEALLAAATQWPAEGAPASPLGWLIAVANRRMTDSWRSELARRRRESTAATQPPPEALFSPPADVDANIDKDALRPILVFMCCHPSLNTSGQIALTLRAIGGILTTAQIARAFLIPEATMAQRSAAQNSGLRIRAPDFGYLMNLSARSGCAQSFMYSISYSMKGIQRLLVPISTEPTSHRRQSDSRAVFTNCFPTTAKSLDCWR